MAVHHRANICPGAIERGMNIALKIDRRMVWQNRFAFKIELENVPGLDQCRRAVARQQKAVRAIGMAGAHMAKGIDDPLPQQDAIGPHQIGDDRREISHD